MPKRPTVSLPVPQASLPAPSPQTSNSRQSTLRSYRPDFGGAPALPRGDERDRFGTWFGTDKPFLPPAVQTMPKRWELAFPTQLKEWRARSLQIRESTTFHHGMIPGQTWLLYAPIPEGEALHLDTKEGAQIQGARQRLLLVCLPPMVMLQEGNQVAVSDPRDVERPPNASKMPQEVITVPRGPRLLLAHELDSLAWAASEDREALIGELLED